MTIAIPLLRFLPRFSASPVSRCGGTPSGVSGDRGEGCTPGVFSGEPPSGFGDRRSAMALRTTPARIAPNAESVTPRVAKAVS
ncbi:hypothetical protein [Haladaptatus salinisoli]|uniref:hypothetical protein n=1 Tax=Haladaptatus salinisoli TaxID=2884876 RepID=UPI001D0B137B|nr:hypothetical protein [Haladaptatus salinisoli]